MDDPSAFADEDLVKFLAAPAPRVIPPWLRQAALREAAPVKDAVFGVFFLLVGLVFVSTFFPRRLVDQCRLDYGAVREVRGRITEAEPTRVKINGARVYAYSFVFADPSGRWFNGECFTSGSRWPVDADVWVRFAPGDPSLACVRGARLGEMSPACGLVVIFPLVGALCMAAWWRTRRLVVNLLIRGQLGDFVVVAVEPTFMQSTKRPQFKITLRRVDGVDTSEHTVRWHQKNRLELVNRRKERGQAIFGLFDPLKPGRIVLPELWMRSHP